MAKKTKSRPRNARPTIVSQSVIVVTVLSDGEVSVRSLGEGSPNPAEDYTDEIVNLLRMIDEGSHT